MKRRGEERGESYLMNYNTPVQLVLDSGNYRVEMPQTIVVDSKNYKFSSWEDGSTSPVRQINQNADKSIQASYVQVVYVANVTFTGSVSDQAASGEAVTLTVTKPDSTKDTLYTTTDSSKAFTLTKQYSIAGSYSVVPSIAADVQYKAATGSSVPFTISLLDRTITVTVTVN